MAKVQRNFRYQRKPAKPLSLVLAQRRNQVPEAVKVMRDRVTGDFFRFYHKLQENCPPSRALRLREVLHCEPGRATSWGPSWGENTQRDILREILALARAGLPGAFNVYWG